MLAPPSPRTFGVNEVQVASYLNSVRDALLFLSNPPICNAVQATSQNLGTGAWTALSLDSTAVDTYGMHSNTTNPSRCVSQAAGYYSVTNAVCVATNATGWRGVRTEKNGSQITGGASEVPAVGTGPTAIGSPEIITYLNVGDYAEAYGIQTSGGTVGTSVNTDANCAITVKWLHN
jgi:hypothetical protein